MSSSANAKDDHVHGSDEQRTDRARAVDVPACNSRPNIELYSNILVNKTHPW